MVWGCFSVAGKKQLEFVENAMGSTRECSAFEARLLPSKEDKYPQGLSLKNTTPSRTSAPAKEWFRDIDKSFLTGAPVSQTLILPKTCRVLSEVRFAIVGASSIVLMISRKLYSLRGLKLSTTY